MMKRMLIHQGQRHFSMRSIRRLSSLLQRNCTNRNTAETQRSRSYSTTSLLRKVPSSDIPVLLQHELDPRIQIDTNRYELERHGRGESHHPSRPPSAICYPTNADDVVQIVQLCHARRIPMIPFGVGTSVEGHVCALHDGTVSIDTRLLQDLQLPDFDTASDDWPDPMATVGAGVTRKTLNTALRHSGLQFVVDPGADATLGGMTACGASGTTAVRYGTMRENLLALQAVLPNGERVQCGTRALKNSAGYDLLGLFCGSEGTLGVITEVTVKLHPIPDHVMAAVCVFDTLRQAAQAVASLKFQSVTAMTRCELLDASAVAAFNQYNHNNNSSSSVVPTMSEQPTLFLEVQGNDEASLEAELTRIRQICCDENNGYQFQHCSDPDERAALWAARHELYYASIHLRQAATTSTSDNMSAVLTDACVPLSEFASILEATARDVQEQNVVGPIFGHAGDGNFHTILPIFVQDENPDYLERVHAVNDRLIQRTLAVGGTCTGEHGVGYGKSHYLAQQYGTGAVDMMRAIKQAVDPHNLMNPGKVIPDVK
ncbi:D-lactate dehydrogenase [cytochrome] 1, mitochondrial [Seminavis robusta]|uniref:D-lactate dehydrogenase (cytochrome) n=1 Tax=Seminavis robusta TaxID=568900 RepID=A0A9N8DD37_9STRA|nr:D-lactate dehydrogenase [cytochrome] 1, mitochondrial [Seminavis robusta]|eukprot:Sro39_g024400.1 D-lactate dehydrogenase [cytochrome] 1, mitochondrial (544) ;mRNA; f:153136-154767